jgi:parallel beta-helix repeat protein
MKRRIIYASCAMLGMFSCKKEQQSAAATGQLKSSAITARKQTNMSTLTVNVPLGGDIQKAIDQVATAGGGTVNLAAGTYYTTSTLMIKSNVTLNGQGNPTTTITGGKFNIIQNATEGLTNVTIQNLKITGVKDSSCYGILIQALTNYHHNVTIQNVQVTNVGMGVHLKRVDSANVYNCNFHDNAAPGKEKYFHNLYIRACHNATVTNVQVNNGGTGNGINLSYDTTVVVTGVTANNNYFRGIRAADCVGVTVQNSTMNGNGDVGLIMNAEIHPTQNINLDHNTVDNNKAGGIYVISGATGSVTNNTATGNTNYNYSIPSNITQSNNN